MPRILSKLVVVIGLVMMIIGGVIYGVASSQLRDQGITVAAVSADNPGSLAGKPVAGPFTVLAQINAIRHHLSAITDGKTYAELPNVATANGVTYNADVTAATSTDGQTHAKGDQLSPADAAAWSARNTAQQASFLQASLLLSVLAFGVATFIIGVGLTILVIGLALTISLGSARKRPTIEETAADAKADA